MKSIFFILSLFIICISCQKAEGIGGKSSIKGVVMIHDYNADFTNLKTIYPAKAEDVYLVYGENNTFYNDKIETHLNGVFEFNFLQKGTYSIYTYSKDKLGIENKIPIIQTFQIQKGEVFTTDTLIIVQ